MFLLVVVKTENCYPTAIYSISLPSSPFEILIGVNAANKGEFICEYYYSCDNCISELLPHPKRFPPLSIAKLWFPPAQILYIFFKYF